MRIFKFCILPILLFAVALFLAGLACPKHWEVEVSTHVTATPEELHPWIEDLRKWEEWTAWSSEFNYTYEGAERGVGAVAISTNERSDVRWEITASDPRKGVWFDQLLEDETQAKGAIMYAVDGDGTKVTWVDRGSLGTSPLFRVLNYVMERARSVGLQANLDGLKEHVEGQG